jgi:hypothetical protein
VHDGGGAGVRGSGARTGLQSGDGVRPEVVASEDGGGYEGRMESTHQARGSFVSLFFAKSSKEKKIT